MDLYIASMGLFCVGLLIWGSKMFNRLWKYSENYNEN